MTEKGSSVSYAAMEASTAGDLTMQFGLAAIISGQPKNATQERLNMMAYVPATQVVSIAGTEILSSLCDLNGDTDEEKMQSLEGHCNSSIGASVRAFHLGNKPTLKVVKDWASRLYDASAGFAPLNMHEACTSEGLSVTHKGRLGLWVNPPWSGGLARVVISDVITSPAYNASKTYFVLSRNILEEDIIGTINGRGDGLTVALSSTGTTTEVLLMPGMDRQPVAADSGPGLFFNLKFDFKKQSWQLEGDAQILKPIGEKGETLESRIPLATLEDISKRLCLKKSAIIDLVGRSFAGDNNVRVKRSKLGIQSTTVTPNEEKSSDEEEDEESDSSMFTDDDEVEPDDSKKPGRPSKKSQEKKEVEDAYADMLRGRGGGRSRGPVDLCPSIHH